MSMRIRTYTFDVDENADELAVKATQEDFPVEGLEPTRITYTDEEVMEWRKANHIHAWFVDNVQDGRDDCKEYPVSERQLRTLLSLSNRVIDASQLVYGSIYQGTHYSKEHPKGIVQRIPGKVIKDPSVAKELLPTRDGFFFGCTEYDEDYLNEVIRTRNFIVQTLPMFALEDGVSRDLIYSSSW